jgi:hypothetical protein
MGNLRKIKRACQNLPPVPAQPQADSGSPRMELDQSELEAILERAKTAPMSEAEYAKLHAALETLVFLTQELEKKRVSIQRLKQLLFGTTTENTRKVLQKILGDAGKDPKPGAGAPGEPQTQTGEKAPGHGRKGAADYVGGEKVWPIFDSKRHGTFVFGPKTRKSR